MATWTLIAKWTNYYPLFVSKNSTDSLLVTCINIVCNFENFRNGAERSGLFCVALYVVQQIKTQQKVDIFSAVKHVRLYRPQCITGEVRFFTLTYECTLAMCKARNNQIITYILCNFRNSTFSSMNLHSSTSNRPQCISDEVRFASVWYLTVLFQGFK